MVKIGKNGRAYVYRKKCTNFTHKKYNIFTLKIRILIDLWGCIVVLYMRGDNVPAITYY